MSQDDNRTGRSEPARLADSLIRFARALSCGHPLEKVFEQAVGGLAASIGSDSIALYRREEHRLFFVAGYRFPNDLLTRVLDAAPLDALLKADGTVDLADAPDVARSILPINPGMCSGLVATAGGGTPSAVLAVAFSAEPHRFDADSRSELTVLAAMSLAAIRSDADKAALRTSEQRLRTILDALPVMISYIDADETYRFANRARQLRATGNKDLLGRRMRDALDSRTYEELKPRVAMALSGKTVHYHETYCDPSLGPRNIEGTYVPDVAPDGVVHGVFALVFDRTEQARAVQELEASLREKERLVRELHHRIKNNLQFVTSLLSVQADWIRDESLRTTFDEASGRLRALALLHSQLYDGGPVPSPNLAEFFKLLVRNIAGPGAAEQPDFRLHVSADAFTIAFDTASALCLIVHEALSSAMSHAPTGSFRIELGQVGPDHARVRMRGPAPLADLFAERPEERSFAHEIVSVLLKQLGARVNIDAAAPCTITLDIRL